MHGAALARAERQVVGRLRKAGAERQVVGRLRKAGAVRAENAHRLEDLGRLQRGRLAHLVQKRIVREVEPGIYYLDEGAWADHRGERLRLAVILLLVVAFVAVEMVVLTQR